MNIHWFVKARGLPELLGTWGLQMGRFRNQNHRLQCWEDAPQFSSRRLYSSSLHLPSAAKLFPSAKNSFWWLSNLCRQRENDRWTGPFCSKLKMPTKNMIVIAGVKCGPGGPNNCVQQGRWSVDTIKFQCKTSRWIRKANTETEKLFSKRGSFWANKTLTNKFKI